MTDKPKRNGTLSDKAKAAFEQAAAKVIERAKQTGTPIIVWKDNRVTELSASQLPEKESTRGNQ
jgi:hypothetical protein